jgi:hypothetical protein
LAPVLFLKKYIRTFAGRVREIYVFCPAGRESLIAEHACRKYRGRVGRSAAAKALDEDALRLAVAAHVRHVETNYDELLLKGIERWVAREKLYPEVTRILDRWKSGGLQDYCQRPADESIPAEGKYTRQTPTSR